MENKIFAAQYVGTGFPPDEGEGFAQRLIDMGAELEWSDLTIDLHKCPAGLLISAFFNAFLQRIHEEAPSLFDVARRITWETDFDFQIENIREWVAKFNPQAPA